MTRRHCQGVWNVCTSGARSRPMDRSRKYCKIRRKSITSRGPWAARWASRISELVFAQEPCNTMEVMERSIYDIQPFINKRVPAKVRVLRIIQSVKGIIVTIRKTRLSRKEPYAPCTSTRVQLAWHWLEEAKRLLKCSEPFISTLYGVSSKRKSDREVRSK